MKDPNLMTDDELRTAFVKCEEYYRFPGSDTYVCTVLTIDGVTFAGLGVVPPGGADEVGRDASLAATVAQFDLAHAREVLLELYVSSEDA